MAKIKLDRARQATCWPQGLHLCGVPENCKETLLDPMHQLQTSTEMLCFQKPKRRSQVLVVQQGFLCNSRQKKITLIPLFLSRKQVSELSHSSLGSLCKYIPPSEGSILLITASNCASSQIASMDFPQKTLRSHMLGDVTRHLLGAGVYAIALQSYHPLNHISGTASQYFGETVGLT